MVLIGRNSVGQMHTETNGSYDWQLSENDIFLESQSHCYQQMQVV